MSAEGKVSPLEPVPESAKSDPVFWKVAMAAADNGELIQQWCRLFGITLPPQPRTPIDRMIDKAVYLDKDTGEQFLAFVYRYIYATLPAEAYSALAAAKATP